MVKVLIDDSTKKLNFFPAKNGISQYYSPHMIVHQRNLNYDKHCQYAFATYIQAHDEPDSSSTNAPCTLDCIYLQSNVNKHGGHDLLHLQKESYDHTPLRHTYSDNSSDYQDGTLHCQERWYAKRFEDNQPHMTSPL
jgi:hypothetical protein